MSRRPTFTQMAAFSLTLGLVSPLGCAPQSEPGFGEPTLDPGRDDVDRGAATERSCEPYAGDRRDPAVDGRPLTGPARCCTDPGFEDAAAVGRACGLTRYLGESEESSCVHRYLDDKGKLHALRIIPLIGLDLARARSLHERSVAAPSSPAALPSSKRWTSTLDLRRWTFVVGSDEVVRRVSWSTQACSDEQMIPVFEAMADTGGPARALPRFELAQGRTPSGDPDPDSLLSQVLDSSQGARPDPSSTTPYPLPRRAETLLEAVLARAGRGDLEGFSTLLTTDARWGLPDRRQVGGRPIAGPLSDDPSGRATLEAVAAAAARLPAAAPICPELEPRRHGALTRGELPMWCYWRSEDGLDVLAVALRGRSGPGWADARVEYIGLFPTAPEAALDVRGEPPLPPWYPRSVDPDTP